MKKDLNGREVTAEIVKQTIEDLCKEYPNAVYKTREECFYTRGKVINGPEREGCIFGQAEYRLFGYNERKEKEEEGSICAISRAFKEMFGFEPLSDQLYWFSTIQGRQDYGLTWQGALKQTNEVAEWKSND